MKMSVAKVVITLLFYIDTTLLENIEMIRFIPNGARPNWKESKDSFKIPQSVCNQKGSPYRNYCTTFCQTDGTGDSFRYNCSCPESNATLTYHNNQWRCLENEEVRNQLGCKVNTLFSNEKREGRLRILNTRWSRKTKLNRQNCAINLNASWYVGCYGEKVPLRQSTSLFSLEWLWIKKQNKSAYFVKVVNDSSVRGRVINLGITCTNINGDYKEGCLLFKLEGNITCPFEKPPLPGFSSSVVPTASSSSSIITRSPTSTPFVTPTQPSSGVKQKHDDVSSSSSLGLIIGVTVSIATILLIIAALIFYRRHKSRKDSRTSNAGPIKKNTLGRSPQTNVAFQPEAQNGFVTSISRERRTSHSEDLYASLNVPEGHNIYGPGNAHEPVYNILEQPSSDYQEDDQHYGSISLDPPVYNALEDLSGDHPGIAENHGGPTEPMYNVLEDPYTEGSERPECYGAIPVNDPFYNTLEESDSNGVSQGTNGEPVYNTLEEPHLSGAGEDDSYGSTGLEDPVYNVLEGPDTDGVQSNNVSSSRQKEKIRKEIQ